MIQASDQMKKIAGIGLGLSALVFVLLSCALFLSRADASKSQAAVDSSAKLIQAVAALSTDPAMALGLAQSVPGAAAKAIAEQAGALQPLTEQIKARASALTDLQRALPQIGSASAAMAQSAFLSSGAWGQALAPLLTEARRPEVQSLPGAFASGANPSSLSQWTTRFGQFATEASRLNAIAVRDRTMPEADKQQLQSLSDAASASHEAMKTLEPLSSVSAQVQAATAMAAPALALAPRPDPASIAPLLMMASLLPALGAMGCLIMLLMSARQMRMQADTIINNSKQSSKNMQAAARMLEKIHALVPSGGAVYLDEHLVEPADSPMFAVASAFNRLIDIAATNRDNLRTLQANQSQRGLEFNEEIARVSGVVKELSATIADLSTRLLQQARAVAGLSEEANRQAASSSHHAQVAHDSSSSLQSAILRLEATRSTNQEASKRIKRMGESSQAIEMASNRLKSMHQQVKVVAANIATAAAGRGSDGRDFMVLADQVQRLVHVGVEVSQDIGQIIEVMKSDASAVTSGMERSTADHVDGGRALEIASAQLLDIERGLPDLSSQAAHCVAGLEEHALALSDVAIQLSSVRSIIERSSQSLSRLAHPQDASP